MSSIGQIRQMSDEVIVEWKIANFYMLKNVMLKKSSTRYLSPVFAFSDVLCNLQMYPNGETAEFLGIGVYLNLKEKPECSICCDVSIKNLKGDLELYSKFTLEFENSNTYGCPKFCNTLDLKKRMNEFLPAGVLTIHCRIKKQDTHLVGIPRLRRLLDVCRDLKQMLTRKVNTDVLFKFKECEIQAHKIILENRSKYFKTMFKNDMDEKKTGVITIDDVESEVFQLVLSYMYCGEVKELSRDNMCRVYLAADKYQLASLKIVCTTFMEENMTLDEFCDVLVIADNFNEPQLMQFCKEFFMLNSKLIMKMETWKSFREENMKVAFQLLHSIFDEFVLKK